MAVSAHAALRPRQPAGRVTRCLLGLAITALATALRFAADPLLHDQVPYFVYVAAAVISTWFAGVEGGLIGTFASMLAGNYFFVAPRLEISLTTQDVWAMGTFAVLALSLVWLVGRWVRAENELRDLAATSREQAEEVQTILDTVPAAVFIARDPDSRRIDGNRFTAEVLRLPPGSNLSKTAPEGERPTNFRTMRDGKEIPGHELPVQLAASRGEEVRDYELEFVYEDQTVRSVLGNASPLRDASGRVRGGVGAFVDITDLKRMERELRDQARDLAEANRLKDEFLATLSHELRTPLNAIVGWSDMLRRRRLNAEQAVLANEAVYRNAWTLSEMIDDVLDVSRIVTGKVRIETRHVDAAEVLSNALDSVRAAAEAKQVEIVADLTALPFRVSADPTRLQQVFWNLLSNAVKFTPTGGRIAVSLAVSDGNLHVRVADTGIGIPADFLPHVFERFRQRDSSTTRSRGGLGLGLAIVRHLVELHGGTVTAESAGDGQGATFTVTLPVVPVEERRGTPSGTRRAAPVESPSDDTPSLCGVCVLVVDDEDEARQLAASALRDCGATVRVAGGAPQALDELAASEPNVLLLDLAMPGIDGFMLIDTIRKGGSRVPAIALSAYAREEDRRRALASGFQMHLAKPVDSLALARAIATVSKPLHEPSATAD